MVHVKFFLYFACLLPAAGATVLSLLSYLKTEKKVFKLLFFYFISFALNVILSLVLMYSGVATELDFKILQIILLLGICVTVFFLLNLSVRMTHLYFEPPFQKAINLTFLVLTFAIYLFAPVFFAGVFLVAQKSTVPLWYSIVYNALIFASWVYPIGVYLYSYKKLKTRPEKGVVHLIFILLCVFAPGFFIDCLYKSIFEPSAVRTTFAHNQVNYFLFYPLFFLILSSIVIYQLSFRILRRLDEPERAIHPQVFFLRKGLTEREREIAFLLLSGSSYEQIAAQLFIAKTTVKSHAKNVYQKTEVKNRLGLLAACRVFLKDSANEESTETVPH